MTAPRDFKMYMEFLLQKFEDNDPPKPFVQYLRDMDELEICWNNTSYYCQDIMVDGKVICTIHKCFDTDEVVGVSLYGVTSKIAKQNMLSQEPRRAQMEREYKEWYSKRVPK